MFLYCKALIQVETPVPFPMSLQVKQRGPHGPDWQSDQEHGVDLHYQGGTPSTLRSDY